MLGALYIIILYRGHTDTWLICITVCRALIKLRHTHRCKKCPCKWVRESHDLQVCFASILYFSPHSFPAHTNARMHSCQHMRRKPVAQSQEVKVWTHFNLEETKQCKFSAFIAFYKTTNGQTECKRSRYVLKFWLFFCYISVSVGRFVTGNICAKTVHAVMSCWNLKAFMF